MPKSRDKYKHEPEKPRIPWKPKVDNGIRYRVPDLPHPFKCSKCDYIAKNSADSKQHWFNSH